jgi:hypothetical protein
VRGLKMHWILLFSQLPLDPGGTTEMRRLQSTTKRSDGRGSRSGKRRRAKHPFLLSFSFFPLY